MKLNLLAAAAIIAAALIPAAGNAAVETIDGVIASFDGELMNLADGWGDATACVSDGVETRCYRSEADMDRVEGVSVEAAALACSSSLRLYSATGYGGSVLSLTTQGTYINLSGYGFNNLTSSYRVGGCASRFYDSANGGAPQYPGNTGAWASASSMASGWNNRISSVLIT